MVEHVYLHLPTHEVTDADVALACWVITVRIIAVVTSYVELCGILCDDVVLYYVHACI